VRQTAALHWSQRNPSLTDFDSSIGFNFLEYGLQAGLELSFGARFAFRLGVFSVVFNRTAVKIGSF
jgi:hypothetical protein